MSGIFGIFGHPEAARLTAMGLYGLQHRGQAGWGIVSSSPGQFHQEHRTGLVSQFCLGVDIPARLPGSSAVGHVQYIAPGKAIPERDQEPLLLCSKFGPVAFAFDGDFPNLLAHREALLARGQVLTTNLAIEVFYRWLSSQSPGETLPTALIQTSRQMAGGYAMLVLTETSLIALRDPRGVRPLSLGKLGDDYVFASETCALDQIEAQFVRDVEPGEVIVVDGQGLTSGFTLASLPPACCIFEHVYFARPDSIVFGQNVEYSRHEMGRRLARRYPIPGDVVTPVPDSGTPAALGYAAESGIPFGLALIRNHYERGNVIEPRHSIRRFGTRVRLNANRDMVAGKRVIVIDDSLARGVTAPRVVEMLREAGAKEVHLLICFPPIIASCNLGIDSCEPQELLANHYGSPEEMRQFIGADSLHFLPLEDLEPSVMAGGFCTACITKDHPITVGV